MDDIQLIWKNLDQIIELDFQAPTPKRNLFNDKLKAKSLDVYYSKFQIEYYNFCHQCENYFATVGASRPHQISFVAFFLWNQIIFC